MGTLENVLKLGYLVINRQKSIFKATFDLHRKNNTGFYSRCRFRVKDCRSVFSCPMKYFLLLLDNKFTLGLDLGDFDFVRRCMLLVPLS